MFRDIFCPGKSSDGLILGCVFPCSFPCYLKFKDALREKTVLIVLKIGLKLKEPKTQEQNFYWRIFSFSKMFGVEF